MPVINMVISSSMTLGREPDEGRS